MGVVYAARRERLKLHGGQWERLDRQTTLVAPRRSSSGVRLSGSLDFFITDKLQFWQKAIILNSFHNQRRM